MTLEESWQICEEIRDVAPSGSFLCDRLAFMVPDAQMRFRRVKTYALGGV